MPVRKLTDESGTIRVPIDSTTAMMLRTAYGRLVSAQDEVVTILDYLCREKGTTPDQVVGFDDETGELIVRP
jgi:hypothetical protein